MPKETISLALASGNGPEAHTSRTIGDMIHYDGRFGGQHLHRSRPFLWVIGASFVTNARNRLVQKFLQQPEEDRADWLLFLDDDQLYPETLLETLMASADPVERRIVAVPVWRFISKNDGPVRVTHNVFDIDQNGEIVEWTEPFPENAVVQVAAVGTGCMMIHRTALEEIQAKGAENGLPPDWCWFLQWPYKPEGEDIWFCRAAAACEISVWINTSTTLQHMKTVALQGPAPEGTYSIGGETFTAPVVAPPATEAVAVIVPVVGRPQNAEPFMQSLKASTGLATVYAVVEAGDAKSREAWATAGATVLVQDPERPGSFAAKVNDAYRQTSEPWLFLCGDDVRFKAGWLDQAELVAHTNHAAVVGTNDLANPRVMRGEHATHMVISRAYVDEVGASWDGPGIVCHEGYGHWFVDDEIVTCAKQNGQWAMALGSIVEHLHPLNGKAVMDPVYEKGQATAEKDRHLFKRRLARQKVAA